MRFLSRGSITPFSMIAELVNHVIRAVWTLSWKDKNSPPYNNNSTNI